MCLAHRKDMQWQIAGFSRANGSPTQVFDLPIEVTGEEWLD